MTAVPRPRDTSNAPVDPAVVVAVAQPQRRLLAAAVLAEAFGVAPLGGWIDPNPLTRNNHLVEYVTPLVDDAIARQALYLATDRGHLRAAALWAPTPHPAGPPPGEQAGAVPGPVQRLRQLAALSTATFPPFASETLLLAARSAETAPPLIAALLRPRLQQHDRAGTTSVTITARPTLLGALAGCGYHLHGDTITLPGSTITLWPMIRHPGAPS